MIDINFLEELDKIHVDVCDKEGIIDDREQFYCYVPVEPKNINALNSFLIYKSKKSKLYLVSGKQRIYLTDIMIINVILSMKPDNIDWFISQFVNAYLGEYYKDIFRIKGVEFEGVGIKYSEIDEEITLFSDTVITINELIFIINFIISKDKYWEIMGRKDNFSRTTLCKYIVLLDYYSHKSNKSKTFLESIGYEFNGMEIIDNKHNRNAFKTNNNIEKFDISKYK